MVPKTGWSSQEGLHAQEGSIIIQKNLNKHQGHTHEVIKHNQILRTFDSTTMDEWGGDQSNNAEDKSSERQKRGNLPSPSGEVWSAVATAALGWGPRGGAPHTAAPGLCDGWGGFPSPRLQQHQANPGWGGCTWRPTQQYEGGVYPPRGTPVHKQWNSMKNDETQWKTMKLYETQWKTMKLDETRWKTMKLHETRGKPMKANEK